MIFWSKKKNNWINSLIFSFLFFLFFFSFSFYSDISVLLLSLHQKKNVTVTETTEAVNRLTAELKIRRIEKRLIVRPYLHHQSSSDRNTDTNEFSFIFFFFSFFLIYNYYFFVSNHVKNNRPLKTTN